MKVSNIKESSLYVADLQRSRDFYEKKLGFPVITAEEGRHVFLRAGTGILLLFNAEATKKKNGIPPHFGQGKLHLAFEVKKEEYVNAREQLKKEGIDIEHEERWYGDVYSFYFRDPDGHSLEVVPEGMWEK